MSVCETIHNIRVHMQLLGNPRSLRYGQKYGWGFTSPNCHEMIYTTQCCGVGGHRGLIISACGTASPVLTGHGHRLLPAIYQMHPLQVSNVNEENQLKPHWKRQRSQQSHRGSQRTLAWKAHQLCTARPRTVSSYQVNTAFSFSSWDRLLGSPVHVAEDGFWVCLFLGAATILHVLTCPGERTGLEKTGLSTWLIDKGFLQACKLGWLCLQLWDLGVAT